MTTPRFLCGSHHASLPVCAEPCSHHVSIHERRVRRRPHYLPVGVRAERCSARSLRLSYTTLLWGKGQSSTRPSRKIGSQSYSDRTERIGQWTGVLSLSRLWRRPLCERFLPSGV